MSFQECGHPNTRVCNFSYPVCPTLRFKVQIAVCASLRVQSVQSQRSRHQIISQSNFPQLLSVIPLLKYRCLQLYCGLRFALTSICPTFSMTSISVSLAAVVGTLIAVVDRLIAVDKFS
jgi:hypothetical protein